MNTTATTQQRPTSKHPVSGATITHFAYGERDMDEYTPEEQALLLSGKAGR